MFEKLLAILPYNPGVAHQLRFYAKRMHEEAAIRRIGLVFIVLTFFIQFFAVLSPPQPTVADSDNNMVSGGISSAENAASICRNNTKHYQGILAFYGITCYDLAIATTTTLTSTGNNYFSMGWNKQDNIKDHPVDVNGLTLYYRDLSAFDTGSSSKYTALHVHSGYTGKSFYILYNCGNLVSIGPPVPYTPPTPPPPPVRPTPPPTPSPTPTPPPPPVTRPCPYDSHLLSTDVKCVPCQYNGSILASDTLCKPCDAAISSTDSLACVVVSKTASNVTTGLADANNSTANAGDVINYTLYAKNNGKDKVKGYVFSENLSDVMDYADLTDLHGGTLDTTNTKIVTWPKVDIAAGQTATVKITVTVKNPIPQTPVSTSDPSHFDLTMVNVYGNVIIIHLPGSPAKTIETATTALPNTGPGTSLFLTALVVMAAGYFYGRARLLARESEIAIKEAATA